MAFLETIETRLSIRRRHEQFSRENTMKPVIVFDWETHYGFKNDVRNQKKCQACWVMPPVQAVECLYFKKHGVKLQLSPQRIINCCNPNLIAMDKEFKECYTGEQSTAFEYLKNHGTCLEEECKYEAVVRHCEQMDQEKIIKIDGYKRILAKNIGELRARVYEQPVTAMVQVCKTLMMLGKNEVYDEFKDTGPDTTGKHGVLVVGYGRYGDGKEFLRIKNSWGEKWCDGGYGNVAMDSKLICQFHYPTGVEKFPE